MRRPASPPFARTSGSTRSTGMGVQLRCAARGAPDMTATSSGLLRVLCVLAVGAATDAALASTNDQFASQVRAHRNTMVHSESAVGEAALLCTNLPPSRAMDEPRCVAWRLHLRALSDKERTEICDGPALSTITHIRRCFLGGLAGSAA